jgi:iron complex transport system substrate-binding protein
MRTISLFPAATEIVAALGALDQLVGVSHRCDYPPAVGGIRRVTRQAEGSDRHADRDTGDPSQGVELLTDEIRRLAPELILASGASQEFRSRLDEISAAITPRPEVLVLEASTIEGVLLNIQRIADTLGVPDRGEELCNVLLEELATVHLTLKGSGPGRPRVAVLEWLDPVISGGGWLPDIVRRAGGIDVLGAAAAPGRRLSTDELRSAEPEVIIFAPCGLDTLASAGAATRLLQREEWSWARSTRLWAVDARALTSRAGPRLVDGVEVFARILHPKLFSPIDPQSAVALTPGPVGMSAAPAV